MDNVEKETLKLRIADKLKPVALRHEYRLDGRASGYEYTVYVTKDDRQLKIRFVHICSPDWSARGSSPGHGKWGDKAVRAAAEDQITLRCSRRIRFSLWRRVYRRATGWAGLAVAALYSPAMDDQERRIRLIHDCRTVLLNRMFDEFSRKPGSSAEQVSNEIVAIAQAIRGALSESDGIGSPARGLFVLALQQVVDSFMAGLLTDEAFEWLAQEQHRADQILLEEMDLGEAQ
jgi:hypothetical protein